MTVRVCQDCGEEVARRRMRCPACGLLVCPWCFGHVHNRPELPQKVIAPPERAYGIEYRR